VGEEVVSSQLSVVSVFAGDFGFGGPSTFGLARKGAISGRRSHWQLATGNWQLATDN
jgi:hypothetical protein